MRRASLPVILLLSLAVSLSLSLVACGAPRLSPSQVLSASVDDAKTACSAACDGTPGQSSLGVPDGAVIYAGDHAVCGRLGNRLFCGACACVVVSETNLTRNGTCGFSATGGVVRMTCG